MNRYLQLSLRQFFERQVNCYGTQIYFISWEFEPIFSIRPEQVQCNMKQPWQYLPLLLLLPPTLGLQSTCHQLIPLSMYVWDAATDPWRNDDVASSMLTPSELCKVVPTNYRLLSMNNGARLGLIPKTVLTFCPDCRNGFHFFAFTTLSRICKVQYR